MSTTIIETYSDLDMQCPGEWENGFKDGVIEHWGEAERNASHPYTGDWTGATFTFQRSDTDRKIREDLASATRRYWPDPLQVKMTSRENRAVLGTPYTVFVGPIVGLQFIHPLSISITLGDVISQQIISDEFQVPWRKIGDGFLSQMHEVFEHLDRDQPEPILYGRLVRATFTAGSPPTLQTGPASADGFCVLPPYLGTMIVSGTLYHVWLVAGHACADIPEIRVDGLPVMADEGTQWFVPHHPGHDALFDGNPYNDFRSDTFGNDRRYTLIFGLVTDMTAAPDAMTDPDACAAGHKQFTVGVHGTEDIGNGRGAMILDRLLAYEHFAIHYLARRGIDSYQTGLYDDHINPEWALFDETVPIIEEESFDAASEIAALRLPAVEGSPADPAGYIVAAVIGATPSDRTSNRRWIAEWNRSSSVRSGWTHLGQFRIGMLHPTAEIKETARLMTDATEILESGFDTDVRLSDHATRILFKTDYNPATGVWHTVDSFTADQASHDYGRVIDAEPQDYPLAPGITHSFHLARMEGLQRQHPPRYVKLEETIGPDPQDDSLGYVDLFDYIKYRCFDAVSNSPTEERLGWVVGHAVQVETRRVRALVLDCEDLIDFDAPSLSESVGSPPNLTCADAIDVGTLGSYQIVIDTTDYGTDLSVSGSPSFGGSGVAYHAAWFKWTGNVLAGTIIFSALGSTYDTQMAVFSGSCGSLVLEGFNDNFGPGGNTSQVELETIGGVDYFVLVAGYGPDDAGLLQFTATFLENP